MAEKPTLFVCHGDDGGPRFHPCRRVQEALRGAGIEYHKIIAGHGSPIPFLRRGSRAELLKATGTKKLPTLKHQPENLRIGPRSKPTSEDQRFDGSVEEIGLRDPAPEREDDVDRAQPRGRGSAQDLEWRSDSFMPSTQEQNGPDVPHEYPHGLGEPEIHLRSRDSLEGSSAYERPDAGRQKVRAL
jgi:hypothetical protein